jgi:hypothetical protein
MLRRFHNGFSLAVFGLRYSENLWKSLRFCSTACVATSFERHGDEKIIQKEKAAHSEWGRQKTASGNSHNTGELEHHRKIDHIGTLWQSKKQGVSILVCKSGCRGVDVISIK